MLATLLFLQMGWASSLESADLPTDGLLLRLDAGAISGVNNGAVMTGGWTDLSGNGYHASSSNAPLYISDDGGYPAVRFDGAGDYLQASVPLGTAASVFVVFSHKRASLQANYRDLLVSAGGTGDRMQLASSVNAASAGDYPNFHASTGSGLSVETWVDGLNTNVISGDLFANRYYVGSAVFSTMPVASSLFVGAVDSAGAEAGQNDIRELLVYNSALSDSDRAAVEAYLKEKYDIKLQIRTPDHPVETYPHPLGAQQFGAQYSFGTSGNRVLDYARASYRQGNRVIKFRLSNKYANTDGFTQVAGVDTLVELVRDQPEVKAVLDMPLTDYLFWVSTFAVPSWQSHIDEVEQGLNPAKEQEIYDEVYGLAVYLLQTYSGSGKSFYLGNWEGDWMLSGSGTYTPDGDPIPASRIQAMIDWANIRQKAVDDAKAATAHNDVNLWFYLEMNKADWMRDGDPCVANSVIPAMPKLDFISVSAYSLHKDNATPATNSRMHSDLDQIQGLIDAKPDATIPGSRIIIGEYGWQYNDNYNNLTEFAERHRDTLRSFLDWPNGSLRFILQWQFYNQATTGTGASKEMSQIGPTNDRRPLYYMHENFYRLMRRWIDDYYSRNGQLPTASAYEAQASQVLSAISFAEYDPVYGFTDYADWKNYHYTDAVENADAATSGAAAVPYNGGLSNLMRYGLGLDKLSNAGNRMPYVLDNAGAMNYAFPYDPAKSDLQYRVKGSADLTNWSYTLFDSAVDSDTPVNGWLQLDGQEIPGNERKFYRLEIIKQ
jgi:hypothetical protein